MQHVILSEAKDLVDEMLPLRFAQGQHDVTRRDVIRLLVAAAAWRCASGPIDERGRLTARPHEPATSEGAGLSPLKLAPGRDGFVYVPRAGRLPLLVMLHGAGGEGRRILDRYRNFADEFGFVILAPDSRQPTWDVIRTGYGIDVTFIDRALDRVFVTHEIDPHRLAIGGFSDGASYALSLGITNGDLFTHIIAFSPGFAVAASQHGAPRIFISHGTEDPVLPVQNTRRLVTQLRSARYQVRYEEFRGAHRTPDEIAKKAFGWFTDSSPDDL